jgi:hypothetical protein
LPTIDPEPANNESIGRDEIEAGHPTGNAGVDDVKILDMLIREEPSSPLIQGHRDVEDHEIWFQVLGALT